MRTLRQMGYEAAEAERAKTDPFVLSWRQRGGFDGALARKERRATATTDHMPFPGHKHCGEWNG